MSRVSVIIPTVGRRPAELERAVRSALDQGDAVAEVLVVLDGPQQKRTVPAFEDERVRVLLKDSGPHGPAAARNHGVRAATAELVALLDDDDHWLAGKIDRQLEMWEDRHVVATRVQVVTADGERSLQPDAPSEPGEDLVSYLFPAPRLRRSPNRSVYPSSLLCSAELLRRVPFEESLTHWEDLDWLLRAVDEGASLVWVWEALTVCDHTRASGASQSQTGTAAKNEVWAARALRPRSPGAYRNHVLTYAVPGHAQAGARRHAARLMVRTALSGPVHPALLAKALAALTLSPRSWARLRESRRRLGRRRSSAI